MPIFEGLELVGGHPAVDFLNSVEYRGQADPRDRLTSFDSLLAWCRTAGLLDDQDQSILSADRDSRGKELALSSALELREALRRLIGERVEGRPFSKADFKTVQDHVARALANSTLVYDDQAMTFSTLLPICGPMDVVGRLAISSSELLARLGDLTIRECEGTNCDWLFLERRDRRRRWCHPGTCGNMERVRRFRARRK